MKKIVYFTEKDNVAVILVDAKAGDSFEVNGQIICATQEIPYGHKIALTNLKKGDFVYKYGEPVARCIDDIQKGDWVHIHNVESIRGLGR